MTFCLLVSTHTANKGPSHGLFVPFVCVVVFWGGFLAFLCFLLAFLLFKMAPKESAKVGCVSEPKKARKYLVC